jgi:hypothetical protein
LNNKEADIAAFIRRHLLGVTPERVFSAFQALLKESRPDPNLAELAVKYLDLGRERFNVAMKVRKESIPEIGFREAAVVIGPPCHDAPATKDFLNRLQRSKPTHTGWTPWIDSQGASNERDRPYTSGNAWEALLTLDNDSYGGSHFDFWRMETIGRFYHLRGLEDDIPHPLARTPNPKTVLDFLLQVSRVAEVISVGLSFARSMGCDEATTNLGFAFRWSGIGDRHLTSWVEPQRLLHSQTKSHDDQITSCIVVPLESSPSGISGFVSSVVAPLFAAFGGMSIPSSVVGDIVNNTLNRQL